ncbi:pseudouridine synthase [Phakopsora pachyrhizi]|uniref:tRNA pseudouridine(55) synthase n=1 Tax=Phakopsora pachyrhizi TaxID=170000 RepID=A0AAV0B2Y8_PHAPC|nr:pseudouridine synthase [Phakopsora pachyrhizi]CAH7676850.1 pseudouridine synthase [Phakopsora pachyrhizi]
MTQSETFPDKSTPKFERPISGLFAINKPSGMVSMKLLEALKSLFLTSKLFVENPERAYIESSQKKSDRNFRRKKKANSMVKIGQGGTLDPLASGVLVIGLNSATRKLSEFLNCTKDYRVTGLLGCETDTYDSVGKVVNLVDWKHVKPEDVKRHCSAIQGEGWQTPPIFSALKMDGKPLYEYARKNIPLPRPIEARKCNIIKIEMVEWKEGDPCPDAHSYRWPTEMIEGSEKLLLEKTSRMIEEKGIIKSGLEAAQQALDPEISKAQLKRGLEENGQEESLSSAKMIKLEESEGSKVKSDVVRASSKAKDTSADIVSMEQNGRSPAFTLDLTVSSGTYVRTIVHEIGKAVSSAATVVSLTRTRQGRFALNKEDQESSDKLLKCIEWDIFEKAINAQKENSNDPCCERDGLREWERQLLQHIET